MVRWLHISDLHIIKKADWFNFRKELFTKCKNVGKIDLVLVTGDLHNFSQGNDFNLAKTFLFELIEALELNIERDLFIVPGNHDGTTLLEKKELYIAGTQKSPLELNYLDDLLKVFCDYEKFVKDLIPNYPFEHPAQIHNRIWNNQINFIHCNTAIVADGEQKGDQLMDVDGLAANIYEKDKINVILAHNAYSDLHIEHQKRIRDVVRNNSIRAYLCGDQHIEGVEQITYEVNQNKQIPCVICYKCAPEPKDNYSAFGIIVGEWEQDKAILKGWRWRSGEGFKIDEHITEQEIYMGEINDSIIKQAKTEKIRDSFSGQPNIENPNKEEITDQNIRNKQKNKVKQDFANLYYNMSPSQIDLFNKQYIEHNIKLKCQLSGIELYEFIKSVDEKSILEEAVQFIRMLF